MNAEDNRPIDELIGKVLADDVPADVDRRLHGQLDDFRRRLGETNSPAVRRSTTLRRRVLCGVSAAAATAAAAVLIWWSLLPSVSLADVAAAVMQQPWIHASTTGPKGETNEFWYSPVKDISAWHDINGIEYRDHRLRIYHVYDLHDKVLYRVPEESRRGMEHFAATVESLRILLQSKRPVDDPLKRLGIPENEQAKSKILKQEVQTVKQDGRNWLDYHLTMTVKEPQSPQPIEVRMLFRVDPETKLLQMSRYETQSEGRTRIHETRFDYPKQGPADVYDLGVPKTAKLVDRVPSSDLAKILETIRAGRQHMDDYRAILIARTDGEWSPGGFPEIVYRKGNKFRRDTAIWTNPAASFDPKNAWPKGGKDAGEWWKKYIKDHCFLLPDDIDRGSTSYHVKSHCVTDPDGSIHSEITGVTKRKGSGQPGETYPPLWSWMPEFACRPPLGIPHETMEPVLELSPKERPPGTILLRVRRVGPKPARTVLNTEGKPMLPPPDLYRNWLDPTRDYAVVRHDMIGDDGSGKEEVHSTIIDAMARSPQGTWYATQIRRKGAIGIPSKGKTYDQIIDIYVDFNADLPDSLFEPPAPGRVH